MGLYQIQKLLHRKRNNRLKREHTEWKRIFACYSSDRGLIPKYIKFKKLKTNNPISEWANELNGFQMKYKWPINT
jgi:hypothetical protein